MASWAPSEITKERMKQKTNNLINNFDEYISRFDKAFVNEETFGGPSIYFHFKCIKLFSDIPIFKKFEDDRFFEIIYAMLPSWGMHQRSSRVHDYHEFKRQILNQKENLLLLEDYKIWDISSEDLLELHCSLDTILNIMSITSAKAKLVANTKVLHHILPNLIPPIDRRYTLGFFGLNDQLPNNYQAGAIFKVLFQYFVDISKSITSEIQSKVSLVSENWHSSFTKVIDNAIIGSQNYY